MSHVGRPALWRVAPWFTVAAVAALILLAPAVALDDPLAQHLDQAFQPPSRRHLFGTDEFGRDILSRVVVGARTSLGTAFATVVLAGAVGVPIGLVAAYRGGWIGGVLMHSTDLLLATPAIVLALAVVTVVGRGPFATITAVTIISIPSFARITQGRARDVLSHDYVAASRVAGTRPMMIMLRTVLPNCADVIVVQTAVAASFAVLVEAALSYLGLGTVPPAPSWGDMLRIGQGFLHEAPYYSILPGACLTLTVLGLDALGHRMRGGRGTVIR